MTGSWEKPQAARVDWVDYAKGFCIVMVVMMHSTLGVELAADAVFKAIGQHMETAALQDPLGWRNQRDATTTSGRVPSEKRGRPLGSSTAWLGLVAAP